MSLAKLRSHWQSLFPADHSRSYDWWLRLRDYYSEDPRCYHTLDHIDKMFGLFEEYQAKLTSAETVAWAIFFHDIIYDPKASDNEEKSAELFREFASECLPDTPTATSQRVNELILMTKTHITEAHRVPNVFGEGDEHYFLDFDMQVLGWPDADYDRYAQQVRQEYIHVPEELYCGGRAEVLRAFLKTPNIYATNEFRDLYEAQARANIEREIKRLKGA